MVETIKYYWLYIASYVYCNIKTSEALLYNTKTGELIETFDLKVIDLLKSLHERKNLGSIALSNEDFKNKQIAEFVNEFCKKDMGKLLDQSEFPERPVQLMPILNLQCDVGKLQEIDDRYSGENVLENLIELRIYLNNSCTLNCTYCDDYFKQTLSCKKGSEKKELDFDLLKNLISQVRFAPVGKLNFLGCNVSKYSNFKQLVVLLKEIKEKVHFWYHYNDFIKNESLEPYFYYNVIVTFPFSEKTFQTKNNLKIKYHFFIKNIEEYEEAINLKEIHSLNNSFIHPIHTKSNQGFFEEFVFTNKEDLQETKISHKQIFAHQKLNTNFFGVLTVLENGNVYANINKEEIGNIANNSLLEVINCEMHLNTAWRQIRDEEPCINCLYQFICPSPSNYELVIEKPNLCNVK